jgi:hypothetical protein
VLAKWGADRVASGAEWAGLPCADNVGGGYAGWHLGITCKVIEGTISVIARVVGGEIIPGNHKTRYTNAAIAPVGTR